MASQAFESSITLWVRVPNFPNLYAPLQPSNFPSKNLDLSPNSKFGVMQSLVMVMKNGGKTLHSVETFTREWID